MNRWANSVFVSLALAFFVLTGCTESPPSSFADRPAEPAQRPAPAIEVTWDETITVTKTGDRVGDTGPCAGQTLASLKRSEGISLRDAVCAGRTVTDKRLRILLEPEDGKPIHVARPLAWVPPSIVAIDGNGSARVEAVTDGRLEGLRIEGPREYGMHVRGIAFAGFESTAIWVSKNVRTTVTVAGCTFDRNERGIFHEGTGLAVERCTFRRGGLIGIKTVGRDIVVTDCVFEDNGSDRRDHGCYALFLDRASDVTATNNLFRNNAGGVGIAWAFFALKSDHCVLKRNRFVDNPADEIGLQGSSDCVVAGNTIISTAPVGETGASIVVEDQSRGSVIEGNTITGGERRGILVRCSSGTLVKGNAIGPAPAEGIQWKGCPDSAEPDRFESNTVHGRGGSGIRLVAGAEPVRAPHVLANRLVGNQNGIAVIGPATGGRIQANRIEGSREYGIVLDFVSEGHTIRSNRVVASGIDNVLVQSRRNAIVENRAQAGGTDDYHLQRPDEQSDVRANATTIR